MTTVILTFGLAAIAVVFSSTARTNITTQQRTTATLLAYEKLEELRSRSLGDSVWTPGSYSDNRTISATSYVRHWEITDTIPRRVSIAVSATTSGLTGRRMELIRAVTFAGDTF